MTVRSELTPSCRHAASSIESEKSPRLGRRVVVTVAETAIEMVPEKL